MGEVCSTEMGPQTETQRFLVGGFVSSRRRRPQSQRLSPGRGRETADGCGFLPFSGGAQIRNSGNKCPFGCGAPVALWCGSAISGLIGEMGPIALSWEALMNKANVVLRLMSSMSLTPILLLVAACGVEEPAPSPIYTHNTKCGNGAIDSHEVCDGLDFGEETCFSQGMGNGNLGCKPGCAAFDFSECAGCVPDCGTRVCGPDPVCGASCGPCDGGACNSSGQCVPDTCVKNCSGRACGPDPVCDESCGTCSSGTCDDQGICILPATGFSATPTYWSVPIGDEYAWRLNGYYSEHGLVDMNGDGKTDFVDSEDQTTTDVSDVWGEASNPHWRVYLNTGTGFSASYTVWPVPIGDEYAWRLNGYYSEHGLVDMNGDGKTDFVDSEDQTTTDVSDVWGEASNPHWRVYCGE